VAITAYARPQDRQRSLVAGFHAHLAKPVEARELVATIAGLLRLTR
jgi:CheY-like chemotaxis protein